MSTQKIPGEVEIKTISVFTDKGVLNIVEHVKHLSIYESIITPGIVAEITVLDTKNIASMLPLLGTEKIQIQFSTPGRKELKYDLVLTEFRDGMVSDTMRMKSYTLVAVSDEVVRNKTNQVSKAYNTNVSNMVDDIVKYYLKTNKKFDVQQTRGIQKVIVPSMQPFTAIDMLRKRSISISDKSSSYVFFENQEGFHFKTIEKLFTDGKPGDRVFFNNPTKSTDMAISNFRNIISYEQPKQFEVLERLEQGGMSTDILKFDYKTLKYTRKTNKFNPSDFKSADGTLKDPDASTMKQYGNAAGYSIWVNHDSGNPDTFFSEGLGGHASGTSIYGQGSILLHVFGDSELTAGQTLELQIAETATSTTAPEEHHQLSGKYLIAFLHHIISPEGNNPRYTCSIEAIKGGYKETN